MRREDRPVNGAELRLGTFGDAAVLIDENVSPLATRSATRVPSSSLVWGGSRLSRTRKCATIPRAGHRHPRCLSDRIIGITVDARRKPSARNCLEGKSLRQSARPAVRARGSVRPETRPCLSSRFRLPRRTSLVVSQFLSSFQSHAAVVFSVRPLRHADGDHDRGNLPDPFGPHHGTHRLLLERPDGRRAQSERRRL